MGSSLSMDGTDDYIRNTGAGVVGALTARTVAGWYWHDSSPSSGFGQLFQIGTSSSNRFTVRIDYSTNAYRIDRQGTTIGQWTLSGAVRSVWQHLACAFDDSSEANDPVFWINAVSQSVTELQAPVGFVAGGDWFTVGVNQLSANDVKGLAAHLVILSGVASTQQVQELMLRPGSLEAMLYWPMVRTPTVYDVSNSRLDGTVTGATLSLNGPPVML